MAIEDNLGHVARLPGLGPAAGEHQAVEIEIAGDASDVKPEIDPKTGAVIFTFPDGSVEIDPSGGADEDEQDDSEHFANIAGKIDGMELGRIVDELMRGIDLDEQGRQQWLDDTAEGIDLLGLTLKKPGPSAGGQLEGTSKVYSPLLLEACLRFQANARGELLPTDGPVKVKDWEGSAFSAQLADALENDLNHYLTTTATEYYPDTDRALFMTGFRGCSFKKVYKCPVRNRPVSESVDAKDLIVSNAATDLKSCGRVTQSITMRPSTLKRMQLLGAYRDVPLGDVSPKTANPVDERIAATQGTEKVTGTEPKDRDRDLYECYCELDIKGFEHKDKGKPTGLPVPYKVTIDRDSRQVLQLCRNWDEDDEQCLPKVMFVKFPFVPGFGFYDLGLLAILGNTAMSATAATRIMLDGGMFANFPGFLYLKALGKQLTNEFRIPPAGGLPIDAPTDDIRKAILPLPYKEAGPAFMALVEKIEQSAQRLGGTAETNVGEGKQDAPVGTTIALIEQATKVLDAVHKRLHQAQSQEFMLLKERFIEDPAALWRSNKKSETLRLLMHESGLQQISDEQDAAQEKMKALFVSALANMDLVPQADPNTSSQMMRIMKATAVKQLAMMNPQAYNMKEIDTRVLRAIGQTDVDSLFAPPQPQGAAPPDPNQMIAQARVQDSQTRSREAQTKEQIAAADLKFKQDKLAQEKEVADLQVQRELIIHHKDLADTQQQRQMDAATHDLDLAKAKAVSDHANADRMLELQKMQQSGLHQQADRALDHHHRTADRLADIMGGLAPPERTQ